MVVKTPGKKRVLRLLLCLWKKRSYLMHYVTPNPRLAFFAVFRQKYHASSPLDRDSESFEENETLILLVLIRKRFPAFTKIKSFLEFFRIFYFVYHRRLTVPPDCA